MTAAIDLGTLADGPHGDLLRGMAERCFTDSRIHAAWVGGSLASGRGDAFSDVDFRVAVAPGTVEEWADPDWTRYLPVAPAGGVILRFGASTLLHHMVLLDGNIVDFLVLDTNPEMKEPSVIVLFSHTPELRARIEALASPAVSLVKPLDSEAVRNFVVDYWIATHKEMKALARQFDESSFVGLYVESMALLRGWFIEASGRDIDARMSLHMLGALHKELAGRLTAEQRAIVGMPSRTPQETVVAVDAMRAEMARIGRLLALRHGFAYPHALEEVVQRLWNANKAALAAR